MKSWEQLFAKAENSGVYAEQQDSSADIPGAAAAAGLAFFRLDGRGITGKDPFLRAAARALELPSYFGYNWDAFEDSLTDLSWHPADGYVLLLDNLEDFIRQAPAEMNVARSIFEDASEFWKQHGVRFFVILAEAEAPGNAPLEPVPDVRQ